MTEFNEAYDRARDADNVFVTRAMGGISKKLHDFATMFGAGDISQELTAQFQGPLQGMAEELAITIKKDYPGVDAVMQAFDGIMKMVSNLIYGVVEAVTGYAPRGTKVMQANAASLDTELGKASAEYGVSKETLAGYVAEGINASGQKLSLSNPLSLITGPVGEWMKNRSISRETDTEKRNEQIAEIAHETAAEAAKETYENTYDKEILRLRGETGAVTESMQKSAHELAQRLSGLKAVTKTADGKSEITYEPVTDSENRLFGVYGMISEGVSAQILRSIAPEGQTVQVPAVSFQMAPKEGTTITRNLQPETVDPAEPPTAGAIPGQATGSGVKRK